MRYLLLSVLVVCMIGVMVPSVFGDRVASVDELKEKKMGLKYVGSVVLWSDKDSYNTGDTVTIYGALSAEWVKKIKQSKQEIKSELTLTEYHNHKLEY